MIRHMPAKRDGVAVAASFSSPRLGRQLDRFAFATHPAVARLARAHRYLADLAFTFPGLLVALAQRPDNAAIEAVIAGRPLMQVAAQAGVPGWLRSLPPGAFVNPLPALPDTPRLRLGLANHLPKPRDAKRWLWAVSEALQWGDDKTALWMAREIANSGHSVYAGTAKILCLYAWSSRQKAPIWHALLRKPWSAQMSWRTAREEACAFVEGVQMFVEGEAALAEPWCSESEIGGLRFVPLTSAEQVTVEADAMRHCLRSYGGSIGRRRKQIVSIRRDGARIATLCIGFRPGIPLVEILEIRGVENATPERTVWLAARQWVDHNDLLALEPPARGQPKDPGSHRRWQTLWRTYWIEKRHIPDWLPLRPMPEQLWTDL